MNLIIFQWVTFEYLIFESQVWAFKLIFVKM